METLGLRDRAVLLRITLLSNKHSHVEERSHRLFSHLFFTLLFLVMYIWHVNNQARVLKLLSDLCDLIMTWEEWGVQSHIKGLLCRQDSQGCTFNLRFGAGALETPRLLDVLLMLRSTKLRVKCSNNVWMGNQGFGLSEVFEK